MNGLHFQHSFTKATLTGSGRFGLRAILEIGSAFIGVDRRFRDLLCEGRRATDDDSC
jgi:hypothetical protein